MDCEKFETAMIDELYDELDELTSAAAKRHVAGCARCAALLGGLRATRRVVSSAGGIPLLEPPGNLEERILDLQALFDFLDALEKCPAPKDSSFP